MKASVLILVGIFALGVLLVGRAAPQPIPPRIEFIEVVNKTNVQIHFDTQPFRTYVVQCSSSVTPTSVWKNLSGSFNSGLFEGHFIFVDKLTNTHRFYRLSVTP